MDDLSELLEGRVKLLGLILACCFLLLVGRTGYLQVMEGERLERYALEQRLRLLTIPAPRGNISDRNGVPLAATRPAFAVTLLPTRTGYSSESIEMLGQFLDTEPAAIQEAIRRQHLPYAPVVVKVDITPREYSLIAEHQDQLPGVLVEAWPFRYYPQGPVASHVLGYVGQGLAVEGMAGVEGAFNHYLSGEPGTRQVEVDHRARFVSAGGQVDPLPGADVRLTLDSRLQSVAEKALATVLERLQQGIDPLPRDPVSGIPRDLHDDGRWESLPREHVTARAGSVVVMDVRTGAILAMASHPGFDPNRFSLATHYLPGTDQWYAWQAEWSALTQESPHRLLNRAVQASYAPGSVFKVFTALAALEEGMVSLSERVTCTGAFPAYGQTLSCWSVHGAVDFYSALAKSCNVYFFNLGLRLGIDSLSSFSREIGLADPTGLVGLKEAESRSIVPSREWKLERTGERWYPPETLHTSIGQGFHAYSPVKMATLISAVANGGVVYRPYLVEEVTAPGGTVEYFEPEVVLELGVSPGNLEAVRRGLAGTTRPGGTAYWRFWDYPKYRETEGGTQRIDVAGKTGTVEVQGHRPHGHFIAFAPYNEPEIAVVALVEHGGSGYLAGAPIAREIIETYFGFRETDPEDAPEGGKTGPFDIAPR